MVPNIPRQLKRSHFGITISLGLTDWQHMLKSLLEVHQVCALVAVQQTSPAHDGHMSGDFPSILPLSRDVMFSCWLLLL